MAEKLFVTLSEADKISKKKDDDFSDRLSSKYTVALLVAFALLVTQSISPPHVKYHVMLKAA